MLLYLDKIEFVRDSWKPTAPCRKTISRDHTYTLHCVNIKQRNHYSVCCLDKKRE